MNVNMPMVPGPPVGTGMPMMANGGIAPPAGPRPQQPSEANKNLLNTYIYEYFLRNDMFECARALLRSDPQIKVQDGPNARRDENGNLVVSGVGDSMEVDNKDGIDAKGPEGLPQPSIPNPSLDNPFLYEWFCLFWDMFNAQKGKSANVQVNSYMNHTQNQSRLRQNQQQEMLRNMRPDMTPAQQQQLQMMRMQQNSGMNMAMKQPNSMAQRAMANNQNNPQMMQMLQQQKQGQMQRDPSDMDGNRARQSSPGSAENAPSPSKRPRLDGGAPFNPAQPAMMPNGRPGPAGQGMPGQQVGSDPSSSQQQSKQLLIFNGIDPASLKPEQFATFQNQSPAVQQKTIQTYAQNLQQQQSQQMPKNGAIPNANGPPGQGSPMVPQGPEGAAAINTFYNADGMGAPGAIRPGAGPGASQQPGGSNHALQDYQMQLMLLEQQNKKRLMMARQEQDGGNTIQMPREGPAGPGGPGGPPGATAPFQGASPQGARPGASPNPADMKRGPQQMNPAGMGSPMAEGAQSRGSPNAMFMANQMDPQAPHFSNMNGMGAGGNIPGGPQMNGMRPPSSHPQPPFNGPMNPAQQQMMAARQQAQIAGPPGQQMQWQQQQQNGPAGPNGNQMVPQGQTPQQVQGTPRQANAMPPPAQPAAAAAAANARNTSSPQVSTAAPPTPSQSNKSAPKKKETKSAKDKRAANQKKSNANHNAAAGATPAAEPTTEAEAPTPATPITPVNPQQNLNRPGQSAGPGQAMPNGQAPAPVPQQAAATMVPQPDPNQNFNMENMGDFGTLDFANPLATTDVLNDFDFDSFLHDNEGGDGGFDFSSTGAFMDTDGIET